MDPYGFVVQGHILCLIYQSIISAFVNCRLNAFMSVCNTSTSSDEASAFPLHCKDEFS